MAVDIDRLQAEIDADPSKAIAALGAFDTALNRVTRDRTSDVDVDLNEALNELLTLEAQMAFATRDRTINIDVDRDSLGSNLSGLTSTLTSSLTQMSQTATQAAQTGLSGLQQGLSGVAGAAQGATGAIGGGGGGGGGLTSVLGGMKGAGASAAGTMAGLAQGALSLIPMLAMLGAAGAAIPGILTAIAAAGGVLIAALAPLVGLLGLIVPALGALALGLGALVGGFLPVIQGVQAYKQASEAAAAATQELEARQHALTIATRNLKDAREALAKAPHEASEAIEDAHFAAAQAILNEKYAILQLQEAQKNLSDIQNKTARSTMDVTQQTDEFTGKVYDVAVNTSDAAQSAEEFQRAQLAVQQAILDVAKAKDANDDAQRDLNEKERKGIKNSDIMVAARRRVADAEYAVAQARKALTEATTKGTAAQQAWSKAMKNLSPAGVAFVKFISDELMPAFSGISKVIQENMLPGIQEGLEAFLGFSDEIGEELGIVGKMFGDFFADFAKFWTAPENAGLLESMFEGLNDVMQSGLDLIRPFSRWLVAITDAAAPALVTLLDSLADSFDGLADKWAKDDNKGLTKFFKDAVYFGGLWWDVLKPIGGIFKAISRAARPLAEEWLKDMATDLTTISNKLNGKGGQKTLATFFNNSKPVLKEVGGLLGDLTKAIGEIIWNSAEKGEDSAFVKALQEARDIIPDIVDLFGELEDSELLPELVRGFGEVVRILQTFDWKGFGDNIGLIVDGFEGVRKFFEFLEEHNLNLSGLEYLRRLLRWFGSDEEDGGTGLVTKFKDGWTNLWEEISPIFTDIRNFLRDELAPKFQRFWEIVSPIITAFGDAINEVWTDLVQPFFKGQQKALQWLIDHASEAWDWGTKGLKPAWDIIEPILDAMLDLLEDIVEAGKKVGEIDLTPWDGLVPDLGGLVGKWSGGPVSGGKAYVVGENGPELFAPSRSGRIMPAGPTSSMLREASGGISEADLERMLQRVTGTGNSQYIEVNTTNEADPLHVAKEIAWSLR